MTIDDYIFVREHNHWPELHPYETLVKIKGEMYVVSIIDVTQASMQRTIEGLRRFGEAVKAAGIAMSDAMTNLAREAAKRKVKK